MKLVQIREAVWRGAEGGTTSDMAARNRAAISFTLCAAVCFSLSEHRAIHLRRWPRLPLRRS